VAGLDVAEQAGGGFELDRACGLHIGHQFATDLGAADAQDFRPAKVLAGGNNKAASREAAFDMGGGMDFKCATRHELADEAAFDDGVAHECIGVEEITLFLDDQAAMRPEIFRDARADLIVGEADVAAAPFAHGGFSRHGHIQFSAAIEADHAF